MCGIVGLIGDGTLKTFKAFSDLLQIDVVRGPHSTGVAAINPQGAIVHKSLDLPTDLLSRSTFERKIEKKKFVNFAYIGHNRMATRGAVTRRNAHPFQHGHITGVHNGTLNVDMKTKGKTFDTDSEGLIYAIARRGIDEAWKEMDGAAAIAYWDNREKTINIVTNGRRPMFFSHSADGKNLIFASEKWMLQAVVDRHNFDMKKVWKPKDNHLFSFTYDRKTREVDYTARELEAHKYVPFGGQRRSTHGATRHIPASFRGNRRWNTALGRWEYPEPARLPPAKGSHSSVPQVINKTNGEPVNLNTHRLNHVTFQYEPKNETPETSEDKSLSTITKKFISKDDFLERYPTCFSCSSSLVHNYDDSVIVDERQAACPECVATAKVNGMTIYQLAQAIL